MQVLIIEDEQLSAEKLSRMLKKYDATIEIVGQLETISASIAWLTENKADLIFLDIHLADGSSFVIFEKVQVSTPIIFTTAFDQYAIDAFKLNSIDYLLKPFTNEDLTRALDKFKQWQKPSSPHSFEALMRALSPKNYQQRFLVETGETMKSISVSEIAYFFADAKYVFMVDNNGQQHLVSQTIDKLTESLNPQHFFRVNRKFLVSLTAISKMSVWPKGRVKITLLPKNDEDVIVSAERAKEFKDWLGG